MINFYDINTYFIFALGLIIGSFLNVVIYRMARDISCSKGRSMCVSCNHQLYWYDLIPLFSYLFLGGKCRYCKSKISIQYPLVESLTASIFVLIYSYINTYLGTFSWYHIILFVIAAFCIVGIFTDFLYHGAFDFSTIWVCVLFCIYLVISSGSLSSSFGYLIKSLTFLVPIALIVIYVTFKSKGKIILSILSLLLMIVVAIFSLLRFQFDIYPVILACNSLFNWFLISLILILADIIIKKLINSTKITEIITNTINYINFILFFLFIFNMQDGFLSTELIKATLVVNVKNIIIVFIFTLFYLFILETFKSHDNCEDLLDADEETIERDENIFTPFIGDGDLFILPFMGMLLGYSQVFSFYAILGFSVLAVYTIIFRKGFKYTIPLYPFIMLSVFILL